MQADRKLLCKENKITQRTRKAKAIRRLSTARHTTRRTSDGRFSFFFFPVEWDSLFLGRIYPHSAAVLNHPRDNNNKNNYNSCAAIYPGRPAQGTCPRGEDNATFFARVCRSVCRTAFARVRNTTRYNNVRLIRHALYVVRYTLPRSGRNLLGQQRTRTGHTMAVVLLTVRIGPERKREQCITARTA